MHAEKWRNIKDILAEALMLDPPERRFFLENASITSETRNEVESLLAVEENSRNFMSVSATGFSKDFFDCDAAPENSSVGQTIGSYVVVGELGIGGMGAVYLAKRNDGKFDQQVAIKLLKREFNIASIRRSFEREIAIQAKLVHPNIAKVLDTGTTIDGIPYIVMEYVEGEPIDSYCREAGLDLTGRLKLFNKACEAVAFAHQNLIVHRDLKPSNIIVDSEGVPKLLDFGISKLLDSTGNESAARTMMGAMTPEYASPEQIRGEYVSTSTDIYSLGVILFKLLTGTLPYDLRDKHNGDLIREIVDSEPILPSQTVLVPENGKTGNVANRPGANISKSPRPLIPTSQLKGDLDNIVLKALSKQPDERYRTVEQFTADVWRFIDGLPVSARAVTMSYRLSKLFHRNKIAVTAGLIVLVSILIGATVAIWQANLAREQANIASDARNAAIAESENAKAEQAKSEKISKFMAKVISYANPAWYAEGSRFGGNARVIDVLDDLSAKIDIEFEGQADIQSELHHKFAEVFGWAGGETKDPSRRAQITQQYNFHALRALELRRQYYGDRHELVAKDLFYAHVLLESTPQGRAKIMSEAIQMMRETNPQNLNLPYMLEDYVARLILPEYTQLHEAYLNAVIPATDETAYQIAERYLRESLHMFRFHYKEDNRAIFGAECNLAYTLAMQEKWDDFDEYNSICKQRVDSMKTEGVNEPFKAFTDRIEKALIEKNHPRPSPN